MHRILYNKIYGTEKDALSDLKKIKDKVSSPKVIKGSVPNSYLLVLYESNSKDRIEEGMKYYRQRELNVFRG